MTTSISTAEYHAMQAKNMTEAELQACVIAAAQRRNWLVYHTHDSRRSAPGFPDLVLVHAGQKRTLFRELKTQTGTLRPAQKTWLADLTTARQDAATWRPIDWFNQTINSQLDDPAPDFAAIAAQLGITLLPWQAAVAEQAWRGNPASIPVGGPGSLVDHAGRAAVHRAMQHYASLEPHTPRSTHPTEGATR